MNRLAPLVRRPQRSPGDFSVGPVPALAALPMPLELRAASWLDDARLFAAGWVGGLIFFGTLFA